MADYKLPDVGEGLTEAEIVTWKVQVGDVVKVNDVVVEIETAKSLVELPSPYAGEVLALHVPEGETVEVGTPIIAIGERQAAPPAEPALDLSNPAATGGGENQTLVGYGPRETSAQRRPRRGAAQPATQGGAAAQQQLQATFEPVPQPMADPIPDPAAGSVAADEPAVPATSAARPPAAGASPAALRVLAKPPVRKLARDLGVDLRTLTPTGPGGTVTRDDVVQAGRQPLRAPEPAVPPEGGGAAGWSASGGGPRERREPVRGVRRTMAAAMVASAFTAPHVTEWVTVDVTATTRLVERLRQHRDFRDVRVSPLLVVAKAVCLAARRTPEVNATWDEAAQEVVLKSYVNLGIAAATPRGLVVPNVKDADRLTLRELAGALEQLTATAREGRTSPADMAGGSFTITNVGVFGVDAGTPIINPGESAILAVGAIGSKPWVRKGKVRVRQVTTLALSFDHRLVDGEKGSRFLADVAALLEDPGTALLF